MAANEFMNMNAIDIIVETRGVKTSSKGEEIVMLNDRGAIGERYIALRFKFWRPVDTNGVAGEFRMLSDMEVEQAGITVLDSDVDMLDAGKLQLTSAWFVTLFPDKISEHEDIKHEMLGAWEENSKRTTRFVVRITAPRMPAWSSGTIRRWFDEERGILWYQPSIRGASISVLKTFKDVNYDVMQQYPVVVEDLIEMNKYFKALASNKVSDLKKQMNSAISMMGAAKALDRGLQRDRRLAPMAKPAVPAKAQVLVKINELPKLAKTPVIPMSDDSFDVINQDIQ